MFDNGTQEPSSSTLLPIRSLRNNHQQMRRGSTSKHTFHSNRLSNTIDHLTRDTPTQITSGAPCIGNLRLTLSFLANLAYSICSELHASQRKSRLPLLVVMY
jgi:hypothetical protein